MLLLTGALSIQLRSALEITSNNKLGKPIAFQSLTSNNADPDIYC